MMKQERNGWQLIRQKINGIYIASNLVSYKIIHCLSKTIRKSVKFNLIINIESELRDGQMQLNTLIRNTNIQKCTTVFMIRILCTYSIPHSSIDNPQNLLNTVKTLKLFVSSFFCFMENIKLTTRNVLFLFCFLFFSFFFLYHSSVHLALCARVFLCVCNIFVLHHSKSPPHRTDQMHTTHYIIKSLNCSGVSGFDNLGHGHYFASNPVQPQLPQTSSHQQAPPRPFGSGGQYHHDASSHLPYSPYSPYSPNSPNSPNTPNAYQYDAGHGHNKYGTNTNNNKGGGGSGTSSYGGNWHYVNSNNDHHNLNHQQSGYSQQSHHVDKDSQQR